MAITKTIGSAGGRDYSTIAAFVAALPANLVTNGNSYTGQCFNDSEFNEAVSLTGHTTDSTHFITLTAGAGQSFRDNANAQTNALKYNVSNGVGIRPTSSYQTAFDSSDLWTVVSNLQLQSGHNGAILINEQSSTSSQGSLTIDNCLCFADGGGRTVNLGHGGCLARNSLFYQNGTPGTGLSSFIYCPNNTGATNLDFCTIAVCSNVAGGNAFYFAYNAGVMENCAVFGATTVASGGSGVTATTCMTDVVSPPAGFIGSKTYANQFVGTTTTAPDFREKAGADLQGAGTSDSTNGANDIVGTARPQGANWDIGAWELVTAGAAKVFTRTSMGAGL